MKNTHRHGVSVWSDCFQMYNKPAISDRNKTVSPE